MNAFNVVNLSAAVILTSTEYATKLGISQDKWVYVLGGAGTHEKEDFWERPGFHDSAAITKSIDSALEMSGVAKHEVDFFDFYSYDYSILSTLSHVAYTILQMLPHRSQARLRPHGALNDELGKAHLTAGRPDVLWRRR